MAMRTWQKAGLAGVILAGWLGYQADRGDAEREERLAQAYAERDARRAESALFSREAACAASGMARGWEPATAVNNCLDFSHADRAIFYTSCLQVAMDNGEVRMTALDVEYHWYECLDREASHNDYGDY